MVVVDGEGGEERGIDGSIGEKENTNVEREWKINE